MSVEDSQRLRRPQGWWTPYGSFRNWLKAWLDSGPWVRGVPVEHRCYMGAPVQDSVWCKRRALSDEPGAPGFLWCRRHQPESEKATVGRLREIQEQDA